ncbi:aminopeptidase M1 [Tanacetum coccineum]
MMHVKKWKHRPAQPSKKLLKITLEVPSQLVALSNMPVVEEKLRGNFKIVSYQESPIMSAYLVAIVVGLFDYVDDHTPDGIKVRVYCQIRKANQGKFALDVVVKTLGLYKDTWMAFGRNTRDLDSIWEETDEITTLHEFQYQKSIQWLETTSQSMAMALGGSRDGVRILVIALEVADSK